MDKKTPVKTETKKTNKAKVAPKKDVKKNITKKSSNSAKVPSTKKTVAKKAPVKKSVETKTVVPQIDCVHCKNKFDEGMTICPKCRKKQKDQLGVIVIIILSIVLLLSIIIMHFVKLYHEPTITEEQYKYNAVLASYEELVRNPKGLKDKDVKIIGKVVKVEGTDDNYRNMMTVTIDANLFDGKGEHLINFAYTDYEYEIGFIEDDIITVYGKYKLINGNIPFIEAKYITFGS